MIKAFQQLSAASWLSLSRLFLTPVAILPIALGWRNCWFIAAVVAVLAGVSDVLDGYVARRTGRVTALGTNLDLLSDKVFVGAFLVLLARYGVIGAWVPVVVIAREVLVTAARLARFRAPRSPDALGKAKTALSIIAVVWLLLWQDLHAGGPMSGTAGVALAPILPWAHWAVAAAVAVTIISAANYLLRYGGERQRDGLLQGGRIAGRKGPASGRLAPVASRKKRTV